MYKTLSFFILACVIYGFSCHPLHDHVPVLGIVGLPKIRIIPNNLTTIELNKRLKTEYIDTTYLRYAFTFNKSNEIDSIIEHDVLFSPLPNYFTRIDTLALVETDAFKLKQNNEEYTVLYKSSVQTTSTVIDTVDIYGHNSKLRHIHRYYFSNHHLDSIRETAQSPFIPAEFKDHLSIYFYNPSGQIIGSKVDDMLCVIDLNTGYYKYTNSTSDTTFNSIVISHPNTLKSITWLNQNGKFYHNTYTYTETTTLSKNKASPINLHTKYFNFIRGNLYINYNSNRYILNGAK